ncbi:TetR/AcrR family transcriptional regulator [Methanoculleus taiwanensis]|uniref:TetR/AcrR family transcriptional regulator n=1 Tax=Methanoculleus taiwanensis TaxID=1550565 RepID=UPI000FFE9F8D
MPHKETTRDKLLRAALYLFTTQGFHATPTAQISREAGVSTRILFRHFRDKETLVNEIYLSIKKEMAVTIRPFLPGSGSQTPFGHLSCGGSPTRRNGRF